MTINKMQSLAILLSLSSAHTMMGSEGEQLEKVEKTGWVEGNAQARPVGYLTASTLQQHPIYQKMKDAFEIVEKQHDITYEEIIVLPMPEKMSLLKAIQEDPANSKATELLGSMIEEEGKQKEHAAAIAAGTESAAAPAQLTWYLTYLKTFYGNSAAMEYALGQNQFDPNNEAHKELFEQAKQDHVAANDMLNDFYTQQFTTLKQKQCVAMAALFKTAETTLSSWQAQLEQMTKDHETQKNSLLEQHEVAFKKNNAALETILIASTTSSLTLNVVPKLQAAITDIYEIEENRANVISWINKNQAKVAKYAPIFAIEDKQ